MDRMTWSAILSLLALSFLASGAAAEEVKLPSGIVIVEKVVNKPYPATVARIEAAVKGANLIIVGEPNYQLMQRMVGREIKGAKAYFIFRPNLGIPIFEKDWNAALEIPLKVLIYDKGGQTVIRYRKPSNALADYSGLEGLGKQLDDIMNQITDAAAK
ncbi:MAG: DUF302 domain-containing protein [Candidatus Rokubacteria bacterium]|nr:DUF302 domain-containing protein [Candidatus Rokubacteria bacterium]